MSAKPDSDVRPLLTDSSQRHESDPQVLRRRGHDDDMAFKHTSYSDQHLGLRALYTNKYYPGKGVRESP